jgi:hypothetical protein
MNLRRQFTYLLCLCMLVLGVSACQTTVAATAIADAAFTAQDLTFVGPERIPSGWVRLVLHNAGAEYYHLQLVQLADDKTVDDLAAALSASLVPPEWAAMRGGPNAVDPGASAAAILYLEPGQYALVDTVPDRQGVPHIVNGMIRGLTVTDPIQRTDEPVADITIDLVDFSFVVTPAATAGEHLFRINNQGHQVHEVWLAKLGEGKHVNDLLMALAPGAPAEDWVYQGLGGLTWLEPGAHGYFSAGLEPGSYALICFVPDPTTGQMHFMQGMVYEFVVE